MKGDEKMSTRITKKVKEIAHILVFEGTARSTHDLVEVLEEVWEIETHYNEVEEAKEWVYKKLGI